MHKPERVAVKDSLPAVHSDSEEDNDEVWSSGIESIGEDEEDEAADTDEEDASVSSQSEAPRRKKEKRIESDDEEMSYEVAPRKRRPSWDPESEKEKGVERLPIKLANGRIQKSNTKVFFPQEEAESSSDESEPPPQEEVSRVEDVSTGARFGRPAVLDVISKKSRKARVQAAKEQIAGICQEIVADPENSVWFRRSSHALR